MVSNNNPAAVHPRGGFGFYGEGERGIMQNDFSQGSIRRHIVSQAIPLTIAQLVQILYNITDRVYIGHLPGASGLALTGIGLIFPLVALVSAFTTLFGMGGGSIFAIARGAGDTQRAEKIMSNTFTLLCASSFLIMAVCYIFRQPVLYALGASDATYVYANDYLEIYLIGTPFVMISVGMNWFINGQGFPKTGMMTVLCGAVLNIALDPVFIFGFDMGIRGAAVATVISQIVSAAWVLAFLFGKRTLLRIRRKYAVPEAGIVKSVLSIGMAGFIMNGTNCLVQAVCNIVLSGYGDLYVGIMTVVNSIREIAQLPVSGIANGSQPVLGYNYGANRPDRVKSGIKFSVLIGMIISVVFWITIMLFPRVYMMPFTSDPEMLADGIPAIRIYYAAFFTMILQFSGQHTFTALGMAKPAIFFSLFRKAILVVPLAILLPRMGMGAYGVFASEPVSNVIGGIACFTTMMLIVWRKLTRMERENAAKNTAADDA